MVGDTHKLKIIEEDVHQNMKSQMEHTHFLNRVKGGSFKIQKEGNQQEAHTC